MRNKNLENIIISSNKKSNKKINILLSIIIVMVIIINCLSITIAISSLKSLVLFDINTYKQVTYTLSFIVIVIIAIAGISIRSIFMANTYRHKKNIALLRLLGFTKKQVRNILWKEIVEVFIFSSEIGVFAAIIVNFVLPISINIFSMFLALLLAVFITYVMVRFSLMQPLKKAFSIEAIEAMANSEDNVINTNSHRKIIYPMNLALRFFVTNKKRTIWILSSLILTTTIMMVVLTVINSINPEILAKRNYLYNSNVIIQLNPVLSENGDYSYKKAMNNSPLNDELAIKIKEIPETDVFRSKLAQVMINDGSNDIITIQNVINDDTIDVSSRNNIKEFSESKNKVPVIINTGAYWYRNGTRNYELGDNIDVKAFDSNPEHNIILEVVGFVNKPNDLVIYYTENKFIEKLAGENSDFIWYIKSDHETSLRGVMDNLDQNNLINISYLENDIQTYKNMFGKIMVIIFGIGILLFLFAFINLFDLLISNFFSREQTYKVLRLLGATEKQLMTIISIEDIIYFVVMIILSAVLSLPFGYWICMKISSYFNIKYILYRFPFEFSILYLLIIFLFYIVLFNFQKKTLELKEM